MKLYHGAHTPSKWSLHLGLCLTPSRDAAEHYADAGAVYEWDVDFSDLVVAEVNEYDREENVAVGDDGEYPDADILVYEDEDTWGEEHDTYRIVSQRALDRLA